MSSLWMSIPSLLGDMIVDVGSDVNVNSVYCIKIDWDVLCTMDMSEKSWKKKVSLRDRVRSYSF